MKVLMTTDTVGGVWTYALELADALARHGVRTSLAAMGPRPNEAQEAEVRASSIERFEHAEVKLEWMAEPWEDVERAGEWLLALADEVRPDVVHLNGYAHGALCWDVPTLVAAHSCVLSWHLHAGRDARIEASFHGDGGGVALANVEGSFYDLRAERYRTTQSETLAEPPNDWGGRAAVAWAKRLAEGGRFDAETERVVTVAETLDAIYGATR